MTRLKQDSQWVWFNIASLTRLREWFEETAPGIPEIEQIEERISALQKIILLPDSLHDPLTESDAFHIEGDLEKWIPFCRVNLQKTHRSISAILITYNEERCIGRCLDSLIDSVDEIIIVDSGSTDRTVSLIESYPIEKIKLYHRAWSDNFSEARNYAATKATSDWLFHIDADEYLGDVTGENFRARINLFDRFPLRDSLVICPSILSHEGKTGVSIGRIYARDSEIRFFGSIHEQLRKDPDKYGTDLHLITVETSIHHDGYLPQVVEAKDKPTRNVSLLKTMVELEPDNPRWKFFLARDGFYKLPAQELENVLLEAVSQCAKIPSEEFDSCKFFSLDLLVKLKYMQGQYEEIKQLAEDMNALKPGNSNSVFYLALVRFLSYKREMIQLLKDIMRYREDHFDVQYGMVEPNGHHIDYLIGVLLFDTGRPKDAMRYFDFLTDQFDNLDKWMGPYSLPFIHDLAQRCRS